MKNTLVILKTEIEKELKDLERLEVEMLEVLRRTYPAFLETRVAGSILHDFYSGIEKIFKRIASKIDRDVPADEDWHTELLNRMAFPIEEIRPAVISAKMKESLSDYLRFQHLFRNICGFELRWERCKALGLMMKDILKSFSGEIKEFLKFIDSIKDIS